MSKVKYCIYIYFKNTDPAKPKYSKEYVLSDSREFTQRQFKEAEKSARKNIYGTNADENMVPIYVNSVATLLID